LIAVGLLIFSLIWFFVWTKDKSDIKAAIDNLSSSQ